MIYAKQLAQALIYSKMTVVCLFLVPVTHHSSYLYTLSPLSLFSASAEVWL